MPVHLHLSGETAAQRPGRLLFTFTQQHCSQCCPRAAVAQSACLVLSSRSQWSQRFARPARAAGARRLHVAAATSVTPPTVSDTKEKFYQAFRRPLNPIYNTVVQELLVQQHIIRYNRKYHYDAVYALGFVSVFEQVLDALPADRDAVFTAYVNALDEDPAQYRKDAEQLEKWASGISKPEDLHPSQEGDEIRQNLAKTAQLVKDNNFLYNRFFAIGLFRLLELSKAKDPQALQGLVSAMGIPQESVNRDLMTYKGVLSKLNAAKEMIAEYTARERKKAKERDEAKAAAVKSKEDSSKSEGTGSEKPAEKKEPAGASAQA